MSLTTHRLHTNLNPLYLFTIAYFNIGHIRFSRVAKTDTNRCSILATDLFVTTCAKILSKASITFHTLKVFNTQMFFFVTGTMGFMFKSLITYTTYEVSDTRMGQSMIFQMIFTLKRLIAYVTFKLFHIWMHQFVLFKVCNRWKQFSAFPTSILDRTTTRLTYLLMIQQLSFACRCSSTGRHTQAINHSNYRILTLLVRC